MDSPRLSMHMPFSNEIAESRKIHKSPAYIVSTLFGVINLKFEADLSGCSLLNSLSEQFAISPARKPLPVFRLVRRNPNDLAPLNR